MNKIGLVIILLFTSMQLVAQGLNNTWLLGNDPGWPNLGRIFFDTNSYSLLTEQRKMSFKGTQATISDSQGNFLMSSNGVWIANANNDTMSNGAGLNPGYYVSSWPDGLLIGYGNLFIPFPGDTNKYLLFHQTRLDQNSALGGIYKTIIDITLNSGLGEIIDKNDTLIIDQLTWGIAAIKHGNGRDWWVIAQKDSSDIMYKILLTSNGIESIITQSLGYSPFAAGNVAQITFSQDGTKFIQTNYDNPILKNSLLIISDFDRCTGNFSNTQIIPVISNSYLYGLSFSPSSDYVYTCTSQYIFQINTANLLLDTVAIYDGFISGIPPSCCPTTFFNLYQAANGKIYITSGSSVQHLHEMNYPDSAGIACDVQQHTISLGSNYFHLRAVPNHPNYNLGPVIGSACDTLGLGIAEQDHNINISVSPNPSSGNFNITYSLVPIKNGTLEIMDLNGKIIYTQTLPPWSTMQNINLPASISSGMYNCRISSGFTQSSKRIVLLK